MRRAIIILVLLGLTGCVADDPDVVVYDRPGYYDGGGYDYETYVYDYYAPGPQPYFGGGYYGRPYPYYIGGRYDRDRHDHDNRDHDRHDGPDRERTRDGRGDNPPPRGDSDPPRVRTRTGFQNPSVRPAARPSPAASGGRQGQR